MVQNKSKFDLNPIIKDKIDAISDTAVRNFLTDLLDYEATLAISTKSMHYTEEIQKMVNKHMPKLPEGEQI